MVRLCGVFCALFLFGISISFAQMSRKQENKKWTEAQELFDTKQYDKAEPLFSHLLSQDPANSALNYYYGVCLLVTEKDKAKAITHLEKASGDEYMWDQVYYYLGRAYQINNDFDNARSAYQQFTSRASDKMAEQWNIAQAIQSLDYAKEMMNTPVQFNVVDRYLKNSSNYFTAYQMEGKEGKVLIKPEHLISKQELNNGTHYPAFLSANGNVMYYTGYSSSKAKTSDIFRMVKNSDGTWGTPEILPATINTSESEVYPMCNEDGSTLFFSSNGWPGMGSFDVFKATYNSETKQWSSPVNIGYPINTADDEYYYTESADGKTAFYATKFKTPYPKLMVYKIQYGESNTVVQVRGKIFLTDRLNEFNEVRITLSHQKNNEVISSFLSNGNNGEYAFNLNQVGDFRIKVEAPGYTSLAQNISINNQASGRMAQWIKLSKAKTHDEIFIVNKYLSDSETFEQGIEALNQMHVQQLSVADENDTNSKTETNASNTNTKQNNTDKTTTAAVENITTKSSTADETTAAANTNSTNTNDVNVTSANTRSQSNTTSSEISTQNEINKDIDTSNSNASTNSESNAASSTNVSTGTNNQPSSTSSNTDAEKRLREYFNTNKSNIDPSLPQPVKITEVLGNNNQLDFKVQIGTFSNQTAEEVFSKLVTMGFDDLCYLTTVQGWHIFLTGHGSDFEKVKQLQQTVFEYGFSDAYVVCYQNQKRVKVTPDLLAGEE
ncbi:MAG TPA: hypothetical protein PKH65_04535 [Bacteroidia bacterium]|nr:hypothetical protein [Bacteroidia bacterium]HNT79927.1 hypothetical protein [Bacteroidia bacterium]